jgi:hypothetical protein
LFFFQQNPSIVNFRNPQLTLNFHRKASKTLQENSRYQNPTQKHRQQSRFQIENANRNFILFATPQKTSKQVKEQQENEKKESSS